MPKKRSSIHSKPSSSVHPSLSSRGNSTSHFLGNSAPATNSVNDKIQQLRLEQNATGSKRFEAPPTHTVHPSLQAILRVPDAPPPRPRPGFRVRGNRGPAGPAPPHSWLNRRPTEQRKGRDVSLQHGTSIPLPDYQIPTSGSLLELTLKNLATEWDFHCQYDQYYIATIPVRYKELLLHYITRLSSCGIDRSGLETLFLDDSELEGATGAEDLTRLDFSTCIGRSLPLSDLKPFFTRSNLQQVTSKTADPSPTNAVPEEWDTSIPPSLHLPRFNSITHLSLANPPPKISWAALLSLLPHLPQNLSHLSLAFWPLPTLTPNSLTAYTTTPTGAAVQFGGSNFYTAFDNDWTEAASILRRVAKSTLCLQWLDLTGCWPWMQALAHPGLDWRIFWAALETVVVGQGWIPDCFSHGADGEEASNWRDLDGTTTSSTKEMKDARSWASVEFAGLVFEREVRRLVALAMSGMEEEGTEKGTEALGRDQNQNQNDNVDDVDNDDWNTTAPPSEDRRKLTTATTTSARKQNIRFERGWDAEWIRTAVGVIEVVNSLGRGRE